MIIVFLLAFAGFVWWVTRRWGCPPEAAPLAIAAAIVAVLYLAALGHALAPMRLALILTGLFLLGREAWSVLRDRRMAMPRPGLIVFGAGVSLVMWRLADAQFTGWDVFSHWGLVTRDILATDALVSADSPVLFKDYPPGSALFHYAVLAGTPFSEAGAYRAHFLLLACSLAALAVEWRLWTAAVALIFGYFGVAVFTPLGTQALEVDHLLAALFGCGLASYYLTSDRGRVWRVAPVLFVLPLLKSAGTMLAVFMALIVITDRLVSRGDRRTKWAVLLLVLLPLAASASWSAHVKSLGASRTFAPLPGVARIAESLSTARATEHELATVAAFESAVFTQPVGSREFGTVFAAAAGTTRLGVGGLTTWQWFIVWLVAGTLVFLLQGSWTERWRFLALQCWLGVCGVVWVGGLLVLYLHAFSDYEGVRLASFERYVGIAVLAVMFVVLGWAIRTSVQARAWRSTLATGIAVALAAGAAYAVPYGPYMQVLVRPHPISPERTSVLSTVRPSLPQIPPDATVYVLWPGTTGQEFHMARYELVPRRTNRDCWSVGSTRFEGDAWTCPATAASLADRLAGYDYVLVGGPDKVLWQEFPQLFGPEPGTLFRVHRRDGRPILERVR